MCHTYQTVWIKQTIFAAVPKLLQDLFRLILSLCRDKYTWFSENWWIRDQYFTVILRNTSRVFALLVNLKQPLPTSGPSIFTPRPLGNSIAPPDSHTPSTKVLLNSVFHLRLIFAPHLDDTVRENSKSRHVNVYAAENRRICLEMSSRSWLTVGKHGFFLLFFAGYAGLGGANNHGSDRSCLIYLPQANSSNP